MPAKVIEASDRGLCFGWSTLRQEGQGTNLQCAMPMSQSLEPLAARGLEAVASNG